MSDHEESSTSLRDRYLDEVTSALHERLAEEPASQLDLYRLENALQRVSLDTEYLRDASHRDQMRSARAQEPKTPAVAWLASMFSVIALAIAITAITF